MRPGSTAILRKPGDGRRGDRGLFVSEATAETLFYHLERKPLDEVLPTLLEKTLARGWRAVVQAGSTERVEALDQQLWIHGEGSFLPHGTAKSGNAELQPVFLTAEAVNPNRADVRFMVDGASVEALDELLSGYKRVVFMFDGNVADELSQARATWKAIKGAGAAATYWQQDGDGRWVKKA